MTNNKMGLVHSFRLESVLESTKNLQTDNYNCQISQVFHFCEHFLTPKELPAEPLHPVLPNATENPALRCLSADLVKKSSLGAFFFISAEFLLQVF